MKTLNLIILISLITLMAGCAKKGLIDESASRSFSIKEMEQAETVAIAPLKLLPSTDGTKLGYRSYVPTQAKAILIFYHGGGAHSGAGYQYLGEQLRDDYDILVITPDIRGHGHSGGRRGDSPSPEQVFKDINSMIKSARIQYPDRPLYLGGHSSGAGLLINYSAYPHHETVDGYVFISPYLGFRSKTEIADNPRPFATAKTSLFIKNAVYGVGGNKKAVFFNYPAIFLKKHPLFIKAITVNMANAQTPTSPALQLQGLNPPLAVWIGRNDETSDPDKVIAFVKDNQPTATAQIIEGEKHLSILLNASNHIGPWISENMSEDPRP